MGNPEAPIILVTINRICQRSFVDPGAPVRSHNHSTSARDQEYRGKCWITHISLQSNGSQPARPVPASCLLRGQGFPAASVLQFPEADLPVHPIFPRESAQVPPSPSFQAPRQAWSLAASEESPSHPGMEWRSSSIICAILISHMCRVTTSECLLLNARAFKRPPPLPSRREVSSTSSRPSRGMSRFRRTRSPPFKPRPGWASGSRRASPPAREDFLHEERPAGPAYGEYEKGVVR